MGAESSADDTDRVPVLIGDGIVRVEGPTAFLVERFWPGMTTNAVAASAPVLARTLGESGATVIETILSTDDEICLWLVEASSGADVDRSFLAAGVPFDRVASAIRYRGPSAPARIAAKRSIP